MDRARGVVSFRRVDQHRHRLAIPAPVAHFEPRRPQHLLERGLPRHSGPFEAIMASGIAQILYLDVPDHAAVDLTVDLVQADPDCRLRTDAC